LAPFVQIIGQLLQIHSLLKCFDGPQIHAAHYASVKAAGTAIFALLNLAVSPTWALVLPLGKDWTTEKRTAACGGNQIGNVPY
jgi:hypothetical protein